jgi:hypothetical protein
MVHGYCIRRAADPSPPDGLRGIDGARIRSIVAGSLGVWVSDGPGEPATIARLREHDAVVMTALATATPLPLRFGSVFGSDEEAAAFLDARGAGFEASLERVRERVEFGLLVVSRDDANRSGDAVGVGAEEKLERSAPLAKGASDATPTTGRRYLEGRRRALAGERDAVRQAEKILAAIEEEFKDLGILSVKTPGKTGQLIGSLAHLVHKSELRPYRDRVVEVRRRHAELEIVPSGPWAPYSFV